MGICSPQEVEIKEKVLKIKLVHCALSTAVTLAVTCVFLSWNNSPGPVKDMS